MIEPTPFSLWLRRRRRSFDLTQSDLAQAIGCSTSAVRKLESGDLLPATELTEKLAERLGVDSSQWEEFARFVRGASNDFRTEDEPVASATHSIQQQLPVSTDVPRPPLFNLPASFTSLVGRAREVAEVADQLRLPGTRLLTLTGPPGSGKTRLGIAVAEALRPDFADGVHYLSLAPITEPALVYSALAHSLGIVESTDSRDAAAEYPQLRTLTDFLQPRQLLLVLDNFEHLLAAAPPLNALLQAAAGLKILATSREMLHLYGEFEYPVSPLALPDEQGDRSPSRFVESPAVQLFVERAQAVQPSFELTAPNANAVAQLCVQLDGLPLALEMAAAQMKWQSIDAIGRQLADMRLNLQRTWRDADPRQQTLRGAIEWSYRLLPPGEQRLFARLGSFVGGCTEDAVEAIQKGLEKEGPSRRGETSGELLRSLVERSLVQLAYNETGEPRYTLLETIRAYAEERLASSGETVAVYNAHVAWFLAYAQQGESQLYGPATKTWLGRLEREHDNFRAVLRRFVERQGVESETGLQLVAALGRFWNHVGHWAEGERWMRVALAQGHDASDLTRARVLRQLTSALGNRGERVAALEVGTQSLALLRPLNNPLALADVLYIVGVTYLGLGQTDRSQATLEEALALLDGTQNQQVIEQNVLNALGNLMNAQGHVSQAIQYSTRLVGLAQQTGDRNALGNGLNSLGESARLQGDFVAAARYYVDSLRQADESGSLSARAYRLPNLGLALLHLGETSQARSHFVEGLALSYDFGDKIVILQCLVGFGLLAGDADEWGRAGVLGGAVERLLPAFQLHFEKTDQTEYERLLAKIQGRIALPVVAAGWAAGQRMSLDEAVAFARSPGSDSSFR